MGRRKLPVTGNGPAAQLALTLSKIRESSNLTLRELAARIGYSPSTLASAERGRLTPSWAVTEAFLNGCGASSAEWRALWAAAKDDQAPEPLNPVIGDAWAPAQLPSSTPRFTGRSRELAQLNSLAESAVLETRTPPVVCAIDGMPGIGKTALALQFAHLVAPRFPGGQLFVNLQGYGPYGKPLKPQDVLLQLMRGLGQPFLAPVPEVDELACTYRSLIAGKSVLIVLDNAHSVEQIRPVIPGHGPAFILITSRNRLTGLMVRDGAFQLSLDGLEDNDCRALLASIASGQVVDSDPHAADQLVRLCEGLPLALRIAAHQLTTRRYHLLSDLTAALAAEDGCLDVLSVSGDEMTGIRSVLSWSCQSLPAEAARAFTMIAHMLPPEFDSAQATELMDGRRDYALAQLRTLTNTHLLRDLGCDRYAMHRLVRLYATEQARSEAGQLTPPGES